MAKILSGCSAPRICVSLPQDLLLHVRCFAELASVSKGDGEIVPWLRCFQGLLVQRYHEKELQEILLHPGLIGPSVRVFVKKMLNETEGTRGDNQIQTRCVLVPSDG